MLNSGSLSIDTLISYHKQEAAEELTYVVIVSTIILGLLSYLGSGKNLKKEMRVIISFVFGGLYFFFLRASIYSIRIHDALHKEIRSYFEIHPNSFINGRQSDLYKVMMENMKPHNTKQIFIGAGIIGIMVILGILTIGEGKVFSLKFWSSKK